MVLIRPYIRCDLCDKKIYHDDNMVQLINGSEFDCNFCSLECANKAFNFMNKAENIDPYLFYDESNLKTGRPCDKDIEANKNEIKVYDNNLHQLLSNIRTKHDEQISDMAKRLKISSVELSQVENGHIDNIDKVKKLLKRIINLYNLSGDDIDNLVLAYRITYKERNW